MAVGVVINDEPNEIILLEVEVDGKYELVYVSVNDIVEIVWES